MKKSNQINEKGITLIELLVALVICGVVIAGTYRLFIAQSKAYTVQDQVVEVQQSIRSVMEILLRDLRMAGFDSDSVGSQISIANPVIPADHSVTVNYEYDNTHRHEVTYSLNNASLTRQLTIFPDVGPSTAATDTILEHVQALNFSYGVDENNDGAMDDRDLNGLIDENDWVPAATVIAGNLKVVSVRVVLTANPDQTNPDVKNWVSPRTLASTVTLRNQCMK
jgi:prepilin-type N-terminal cleavage/methylation domain-containing protein